MTATPLSLKFPPPPKTENPVSETLALNIYFYEMEIEYVFFDYLKFSPWETMHEFYNLADWRVHFLFISSKYKMTTPKAPGSCEYGMISTTNDPYIVERSASLLGYQIANEDETCLKGHLLLGHSLLSNIVGWIAFKFEKDVKKHFVPKWVGHMHVVMANATKAHKQDCTYCHVCHFGIKCFFTCIYLIIVVVLGHSA